jgi:hypothetical protein
MPRPARGGLRNGAIVRGPLSDPGTHLPVSAAVTLEPAWRLLLTFKSQRDMAFG